MHGFQFVDSSEMEFWKMKPHAYQDSKNSNNPVDDNDQKGLLFQGPVQQSYTSSPLFVPAPIWIWLEIIYRCLVS